jgi:hypothetical protein
MTMCSNTEQMMTNNILEWLLEQKCKAILIQISREEIYKINSKIMIMIIAILKDKIEIYLLESFPLVELFSTNFTGMVPISFHILRLLIYQDRILVPGGQLNPFKT